MPPPITPTYKYKFTPPPEPKKASMWDWLDKHISTPVVDQIPSVKKAVDEYAQPTLADSTAPLDEDGRDATGRAIQLAHKFMPTGIGSILTPFLKTAAEAKGFASGAAEGATNPQTLAQAGSLALSGGTSAIPQALNTGANIVMGAHGAHQALDPEESLLNRSLGGLNALTSGAITALSGLKMFGGKAPAIPVVESPVTSPAETGGSLPARPAASSPFGLGLAVQDAKRLKPLSPDEHAALSNILYDPKTGNPTQGKIQSELFGFQGAPKPSPAVDIAKAEQEASGMVSKEQLALRKTTSSLEDKFSKADSTRDRKINTSLEKDFAKADTLRDKAFTNEAALEEIAARKVGKVPGPVSVTESVRAKTPIGSESSSQKFSDPIPEVPDGEGGTISQKPLGPPRKTVYTNLREATAVAMNRPGWHVEDRKGLFHVVQDAVEGVEPSLKPTTAAKKAAGEVWATYSHAQGAQKKFGGKIVGSLRDGFMLVDPMDPTPAYEPPSGVSLGKTKGTRKAPAQKPIVAERTITPEEEIALGLAPEAAVPPVRFPRETVLDPGVAPKDDIPYVNELKGNGTGEDSPLPPVAEAPLSDFPPEAPVKGPDINKSEMLAQELEKQGTPIPEQIADQRMGPAPKPYVDSPLAPEDDLKPEFRRALGLDVPPTPKPRGVIPILEKPIEEMMIQQGVEKGPGGTKGFTKGQTVKSPPEGMLLSKKTTPIEGEGWNRTPIEPLPAETPIEAVAPVEEAPAPTKQNGLRVVDTAGTVTGKDVHGKVLSQLESLLPDSQKAAGFSKAEFRKLGSGGEILIDGESVATLDNKGVLKWRSGENIPETKLSSVETQNSVGGETYPSERARQAVGEVAKALSQAKGAGKVDIQVPGGPTFTIENNPHAIQALLDRVRKGGPSMWKDLKNPGSPKGGSEVGAAQIPLMGHVASTLVGAGTGAVVDDKHPLRGAILGGTVGALAPGAALGLIKAAKEMPNISDITMKDIASKAEEAFTTSLKLLPDYNRFRLLLHTTNLPINMWVGPWGSATMASLEHAIKGDERGLEALKLLFDPRVWKEGTFARGWWEAQKDAKNLIDMSNTRAEGQVAENAPQWFRQITSLPGQGMTSGDLAASRILQKAGFTEEEARQITLTSEPYMPFNKGISAAKKGAMSEGGKKSVLMNLALPFYRTNANQAEQSLERTPGIGWLVNRYAKDIPSEFLKTQVPQQVLGFTVGYASYKLGQEVGPEADPLILKLLKNGGGQYGMIASTAFLAGQLSKSNKDDWDKAKTTVNNIINNASLPTLRTVTDAATSVYNLGKGKDGNGKPFHLDDALSNTLVPQALKDEAWDEKPAPAPKAPKFTIKY